MLGINSTFYKKAITAQSNGFIVGPYYDSILLIGMPLIALFIGGYVFDHKFLFETTIFGTLSGVPDSLGNVLMGTLIYSHLFIVIFRSHVNRKIFQLYPYRFTVVPSLLIATIILFPKAGAIAAFIAAWWDVYHSSMQTFGFGRIYDKKAGNDSEIGRRLDYFLNLLLYIGPILSGWALLPHLQSLYHLNVFGEDFILLKLPDIIFARNTKISYVVIEIGVPFLAYYIYSYWCFYKAGYKISIQKVLLLMSTAICSILAWGFNSFGHAFVIMNMFHAIQYFAIVWHFEKGNMKNIFGLKRFSKTGTILTFILFISIGVFIGNLLHDASNANHKLFAIAITVSLMHFWYDSFIWSVRKGQV